MALPQKIVNRKKLLADPRLFRYFILYVSIFIVFTLHLLSKSILIGIFNFGLTKNTFTDLWGVTKHSECYVQDGWKIYEFELHNDCRNYFYGKPFIYFLHLIQIDLTNYLWLGWIQILILTLILSQIVFLYSTNMRREVIFFTIFSPPVLLLVSLGNSDILILFMVYLSFKIIKNNQNLFLGFLLIILATLIKLYTLPILFLYIGLFKKITHKLIGFILATFVLFSVLDSQLEVGSGALARLHYNASFGVSIFGLWGTIPYIGLSLSPIVMWLLGMVFTFILALTLFVIILRGGLLKAMQGFDFNFRGNFEWIALSIVCLSLYFIGTSFDYKLVWFIWLGAVIPSISNKNSIRDYFRIAMVLSLWLSYAASSLFKTNKVFAILQPIGDVLLTVQSALALCYLIFYVIGFLQAKNLVSKLYS